MPESEREEGERPDVGGAAEPTGTQSSRLIETLSRQGICQSELGRRLGFFEGRRRSLTEIFERDRNENEFANDIVLPVLFSN